MTVCPIAIAVGCKHCAVVSVCPLKDVIGDHKPDADQAKPQPEKAPDEERSKPGQD